MQVAKDTIVEIRYELFDKEGDPVESSDGDEPVTYLHGYGEIVPGLERALEGMAAGADLEIRLGPDDAFGAYNLDGVVAIARDEFPPNAEIVPGDWITVDIERSEGEPDPEDPDELEMRVIEIRPDTIFLDANHPLAGQDVTFKVQVLSVRRATPDELAERAHVHDCDEHGC